MLSIIINIVTIIMGLIGFHIAYQARGWIIFIYYTELSNLMGLISSLLYLIKVGHATVFRYTVAVMLFMTITALRTFGTEQPIPDSSEYGKVLFCDDFSSYSIGENIVKA